MQKAWWMRHVLLAPDDGAGGGGSADDRGGTGEGQGGGEADDNGDEAKTGERGAGEEGGKGPVYTQEDVDRRVTEAIKTREKKLQEERRIEREKAEAEKAAAEGKYKELWEKAEREKTSAMLRIQTRDALAEKGLQDFEGVFEADTSTLEGRLEAAEGLKKRFDKAVEAEVLKRLETGRPGGKGAPASTTKGGGQKLAPEDVDKMSQAEYEDAVKKGLIG